MTDPLPSKELQSLTLHHLRAALQALHEYDSASAKALLDNYRRFGGPLEFKPTQPGERRWLPISMPATDPETLSPEQIEPRSIRDATDKVLTEEAEALATLLATPERAAMVHVTLAYNDPDGTVRHGHGVAGQTTGASLRQFILAAKRHVSWLSDKLVVRRG